MDLGRPRGIHARSRLLAQQLEGRADRLWAPVYLAVFAAVLAIQIFLPPVVGMADNGDSSRLIGDQGLTPNYPPADRFFAYFAPDYLASPAHNPGGGPFYTGQLAVRASEVIGRFKPAGHFDIRWLGFVHLALYLICFGLLLHALRKAPRLVRYVAPALAVYIFGDVFYAAYLNSFYTDTMGFLCYFALIAAMAMILSLGNPAWASAIFACVGVAFAFSKPLNGGNAVLLGLVVALFTGFRARGYRRYAGVLAGLVVLAAGVSAEQNTPWLYGYPALVDVVMVRIAKAPNGLASIQEFGLLPSDMRFAGMNVFVPKGPGFDPGFTERFRNRTAGNLAAWYLRHPGQTIQFLHEDLDKTAPHMRPPLGNFEKRYGLGVMAQSHSFSSWSDGRSKLLQVWPAHILVLYAASFAVLIASMWRRWRRLLGFGLLLAALAMLGIVQFCCASLLDALETPRHLFMFHVTTDFLILLHMCAALDCFSVDHAHPAARFVALVQNFYRFQRKPV